MADVESKKGILRPIETVITADGNFTLYKVCGQSWEHLDRAVEEAENDGINLVAPEAYGHPATPYKRRTIGTPMEETVYLAGDLTTDPIMIRPVTEEKPLAS